MTWRYLFSITATSLAAACQPLTSVEPGPPQAGGVAADAAIRTDAARYTLTRDGNGLATTIGIRFQNQSDRRMYIVNCRGDLAPSLQKRVNGAWSTTGPVPSMHRQRPCRLLTDELLVVRKAVEDLLHVCHRLEAPGVTEADYRMREDLALRLLEQPV
jgi:uncharacterized protein YcsI (UPF0317 family)